MNKMFQICNVINDIVKTGERLSDSEDMARNMRNYIWKYILRNTKTSMTGPSQLLFDSHIQADKKENPKEFRINFCRNPSANYPTIDTYTLSIKENSFSLYHSGSKKPIIRTSMIEDVFEYIAKFITSIDLLDVNDERSSFIIYDI